MLTPAAGCQISCGLVDGTVVQILAVGVLHVPSAMRRRLVDLRVIFTRRRSHVSHILGKARIHFKVSCITLAGAVDGEVKANFSSEASMF